jgi:MATE family multidrug resistance protein
MGHPHQDRALTRSAVLAQAWPIMLGQALVPLVGIVDAAVIGRTGDTAALAGVALGAAIISLVFWSFGFLRMGLSGLVAQAAGSGRGDEVDALLLRGIALGLGLGCIILVLQRPLAGLAFLLLPGAQQVGAPAHAFVSARFVGAPAALAVFAINGWLIGLGRTRAALALQIVMNAANLLIDVILVWRFGMGARGVGLGTASAEWIALFAGLVLAVRMGGAAPLALLRRQGWRAVADHRALARLFAVNRDLMIRTIALLALFTWLANAGARLGTTTLAANHILLQFVNVAAFVLDAFAFTAEERIGHAVGARSSERFRLALRLTSEFTLAGGLAMTLLTVLAGPLAIYAMTTDEQVRAAALALLPFAAAAPLLGGPSWLLDGVFIGATRGRALRDAALVSTAGYLLLDLALRPWGTVGLWTAFCGSYLLRAGTLAVRLPRLLREVAGG